MPADDMIPACAIAFVHPDPGITFLYILTLSFQGKHA